MPVIRHAELSRLNARDDNSMSAEEEGRKASGLIPFDDEVLIDMPISSGKQLNSSIWKRIFRWPCWTGRRSFQSTITSREYDTLQSLMRWSRFSLDEAFKELNSSEDGLEAAQARQILVKHGYNILSRTNAQSWWWLLLCAIPNPLNIMLVVVGSVAFVTESDLATFIILLSMVVLSVGLRFVQEVRSTSAAASLSQLISSDCDVLRRWSASPSTVETVPRKTLVPGDVVILQTGSIVPADCLLIESNLLSVSQSTFTGEGYPVAKRAILQGFSSKVRDAFAAPNILFLGSHVISGSGRAVILTTGNDTYMSVMASVLTKSKPANSFQKGIRKVLLLFLGLMVVMVPVTFAIEGSVSHNWKEAGMFCIAAAISLVPEMFPMIVSSNLARGAVHMSRRNVIVKQFDAIQLLGAVDVICCDKTGTLTEDQILLHTHVDPFGNKAMRPLQMAYLNAYCHGSSKNNPTDAAIVTVAQDPQNASSMIAILQGHRRLAEIPFDFDRRLSSVIVSDTANKKLLVCKGAAEEILRKCTQMRKNDEVCLIDRNQLQEVVFRMNKEGLRTIGVATRVLRDHSTAGVSSSDEMDLVCEGFIGFLDAAKQDAGKAIRSLSDLGIETKVLTGDNLATAVRICRDLDIISSLDNQDEVVTGAELARLDATGFAAAVRKCKVLAKLTPMQKLEVVESLRAQGRTVAFLGDGINDAPALRGADVGISVNTGSDVAKDAADVILTEKSLGVITDGVRIGRITSTNTIKYIKITASSNFSNVISIIIAAAWLPYIPMRPIQLLAQSLLFDVSQASIPWDRVDTYTVLQPRALNTTSIAKFMIFIGPTSSILDFATFALGWWYYGIQGSATETKIDVFRTQWFLEGVLSQALIIHFLRTAKVPLVQSCSSVVVFVTTFAVAIIGIAIPFTPLGHALQMERPDKTFWGFLAAVPFIYFAIIQLAKLLYIRAFKEWL